MTSFVGPEKPNDKSGGSTDWSRNELLDLLAHDIRNSIQGVVSWANLICRQTVSNELSDETKSKGLEVITRNCRLQTRLVKQLVVLSRRDCGELTSEDCRVSIRSVLEDAIYTLTPQAQANGIDLQVELAASDDSVIADPVQLEQVFTNLLSNAVKFTPAGGSITVSLKYIDRTAQITVSDTGRGISAQFLPFVFERYHQEKRNAAGDEGLGLGMSIARYLVERHRGSIYALSAGEGKGATFIVCLPVAANKVLETSQPQTRTTSA